MKNRKRKEEPKRSFHLVASSVPYETRACWILKMHLDSGLLSSTTCTLNITLV